MKIAAALGSRNKWTRTGTLVDIRSAHSGDKATHLVHQTFARCGARRDNNVLIVQYCIDSLGLMGIEAFYASDTLKR